MGTPLHFGVISSQWSEYYVLATIRQSESRRRNRQYFPAVFLNCISQIYFSTVFLKADGVLATIRRSGSRRRNRQYQHGVPIPTHTDSSTSSSSSSASASTLTTTSTSTSLGIVDLQDGAQYPHINDQHQLNRFANSEKPSRYESGANRPPQWHKLVGQFNGFAFIFICVCLYLNI